MRVNQGAKEGAVVARTVFLALLSVGDCANVIKNVLHEDDLDE